MKITVIGAGAMGMLFGGYLSKHNEVVLIDIDELRVDRINQKGIRIQEPGGRVTIATPKAALPEASLEVADLAILFVTAIDSRSALRASHSLIGPETQLMSLQNGSGHDAVMREFVGEDRIIIGTTQHNSSVIEAGVIRHGGGGKTFIGPVSGEGHRLKPIEQTFNACGFETEISDNIRRRVWEKLFINTSASALTAVFQTNLGFILEDSHAWALATKLVREAVAVANREGMGFEEKTVLDDLHRLLENARSACTSICADIRDGRKTEVDSISGAIVAAGKRADMPTPCHEFVVELIHALENKKRA